MRGTYTVTAILQRCTEVPDEVLRAEPVRITVVPPPYGELPSNGPCQPMVGIGARPRKEGDVRVGVGVLDWDGYARVFRIDWGDGSPPTQVERSLAECHDTPTSYPRDPYPGADVRYQYAAPGTYRITVTVQSAGYDGGSIQTAQRAREVTAGRRGRHVHGPRRPPGDHSGPARRLPPNP